MILRLTSRTKRALKLSLYVLFALTILSFFHIRPSFSRGYSTRPWTACPNTSLFSPSCHAQRARIANDVLVVVKTGGSEPQDRLIYQWKTILSVVPRENVVVLSDLEEVVDGRIKVHDVYADLSLTEWNQYPEFELYNTLRSYKAEGNDTRQLDGGWNLAKYMNLAMTRRVWSMVQGKVEGKTKKFKWFLFVDTDTYVDWDNLFALLEVWDANEELYIGSPVWSPGVVFAHGGSAYILSLGALATLNEPSSGKNIVKEGDPMYSQYGLNVTAWCCGDYALAVALKERGIRLKGYWPLLNGEVPATVPFGKEIWCEPVVTLHHVGEQNMEDLWTWIEKWKQRTRGVSPLLFKDLFQYVSHELTSMRKDWDNIEDTLKIPVRSTSPSKNFASFDQCKAACEADAKCMQFVWYHGDTCALSSAIRIGRERKESGGRYVSGWMEQRISAWVKAEERACADGAHWVKSNP